MMEKAIENSSGVLLCGIRDKVLGKSSALAVGKMTVVSSEKIKGKKERGRLTFKLTSFGKMSKLV